MEIIESFKMEGLEGAPLFDFVPFNLHMAEQREALNTWAAHFKKKKVPFIVVEKKNDWSRNPNLKLTALYKEKYAGTMDGTVSLESLVTLHKNSKKLFRSFFKTAWNM